jgi:hypothetical protein
MLAVQVALPGHDDEEEEATLSLLQERIRGLPEFKQLGATMDPPEQI